MAGWGESRSKIRIFVQSAMVIYIKALVISLGICSFCLVNGYGIYGIQELLSFLGVI